MGQNAKAQTEDQDQGKDGPALHDIISIEQRPAVLDVNFEALKSHLSERLKKYEIVVTEDTVSGARALATELNKTAQEIDRRRKAEVAAVSEPIKQFDARMKELVTMCKDGRQKIQDQIQKFEEETRKRCEELLRETRDTMWADEGVEDEFKRAEYDDLVKVGNVTGKGKLTRKTAGALLNRVKDDRALQDRTKMRLMALENASYRAGLSAPLTRDHVAHFLFAPDETYEAELKRILDAEVERQREAERAMRAKMEREERERREREEAQAREDERRQQAATAPAGGAEASAPTPSAEQPAPAPQAASESGEKPEVPPTSTQSPPTSTQEPPPGKVAWTIYARFEIAVSPRVEREAIEEKLKKMLADAGITSLKHLQANRAYNPQGNDHA